jgi:hypothetical protein
MTTEAIVVIAFLGLDFGAVLTGLFYLAQKRAERDPTDVRRRERRYRY